MATTENPLSAFFEAFQSSRKGVQDQQRQAAQDALNEQLKQIQMAQAQAQLSQVPMQQALLAEQLRKAMMSPEQQAIESARAANIQGLANQPGVIFQQGGPVEEITPQAQNILSLREVAAQGGGVPFTREGIPGIEMQTAIPGLPGAVRSPAEIKRIQDQARDKAALSKAIEQELETPEEKAQRAANLAKSKVETAKLGAILDQIQNIATRGGKNTNPVYDPTGTQVIAYEYFDPIKGATDLIDIKTPKDAEDFKLALDQSNKFDDDPAVKNYSSAIASIRGIQNLASDPNATAADDTALIFAFMKSIDPRSTVREGEQASVQNSAGIPDRIRNIYNNAVAGNRLTPTQRVEILGAAEKSVSGLKTGYDLTRTRFIDKSRRSKLDENIVVGPALDHRSIMRENKASTSSGSTPTQGKIIIIAPDGQAGEWPSNRPIPEGFTAQ